MTDLAALTAFAHELADLARAQTLPRFRSGLTVHNKEDEAWDPVTEADREAERAIRARIEEIHPDHGIIGEEFGTARADAPLRWVLDPVDGTRAFVCGTTSWTTLIALEQDGVPVLGVIDQAFTGERWVGTAERTTYFGPQGSRDVVARSTTELARARMTATDPVKTGFFTEEEAEAFGDLVHRAEVARYSLDAYGYALVAMGELDLVVEASLQHYDWAALLPVLQGAGAVVSGWRGEPIAASPRGRIVAAATPELHAVAIERLRSVSA